ncbi:MAG TPA: polysaccharide biosynthesis C-terminal domain-containing protein [Luteibaculaceae bacterium]|nr:polysaccharide biosynthesis C-terminal domain-containing protein [Luteibaculaceae bacterium]
MGIIKGQSKRGLLFNYIGVALGFLSTYLQPLFLSAGQIGLVKILNSYSNIFVSFCNLGFEGAALRFFPKFRNPNNGNNGFLGLALLFLVIGFLSAAVAFFLLKDQLIGRENQGLEVYIYLVLPLIFFNLVYLHLDAYRVSLFNASIGILYKEVFQRVGIVMAVLLVGIQAIDFHVFVYLYCFSLCLPGLTLLFDLWKQGELKPHFNFHFFSGKLRRDFLLTAGFTFLANAPGVIIGELDVVMIKELKGLSYAGIYTMLFFYATMISIPSRPVKRISYSIVAEAWNNADLDIIRDVYRKSALNQLIIGLFLFIGLWTNRALVFYILPEEYAGFDYVLFFIGLNNLIDMGTGVSGEILATSDRYKYNLLFVGLLIALGLLTNWMLIPVYGIEGAAFATFCSVSLFNLIRFFCLYKWYGLQPFNSNFIKVLAIGGVVWLIAAFIPTPEHVLLDFLVRGTFITCTFIPLIYIFSISEDFNELVVGVLRRLKIRN